MDKRIGRDVHGHFNVVALRPPGYDPKGKWEFAPETSIDFMDRTGDAAQLLSNYGPQTTAAMIAANNQGAALVAKNSARFGLLAQLPRDALGRNALRLFPKFAKRVAGAAVQAAAE